MGDGGLYMQPRTKQLTSILGEALERTKPAAAALWGALLAEDEWLADAVGTIAGCLNPQGAGMAMGSLCAWWARQKGRKGLLPVARTLRMMTQAPAHHNTRGHVACGMRHVACDMRHGHGHGHGHGHMWRPARR